LPREHLARDVFCGALRRPCAAPGSACARVDHRARVPPYFVVVKRFFHGSPALNVGPLLTGSRTTSSDSSRTGNGRRAIVVSSHRARFVQRSVLTRRRSRYPPRSRPSPSCPSWRARRDDARLSGARFCLLAAARRLTRSAFPVLERRLPLARASPRDPGLASGPACPRRVALASTTRSGKPLSPGRAHRLRSRLVESRRGSTAITLLRGLRPLASRPDDAASDSTLAQRNVSTIATRELGLLSAPRPLVPNRPRRYDYPPLSRATYVLAHDVKVPLVRAEHSRPALTRVSSISSRVPEHDALTSVRTLRPPR